MTRTNSSDGFCGLQKCYLPTFYPAEGLVSHMEATDNVTYFYFSLSFKLSADWMMLKHCLNRINMASHQKRKVNNNVHPGIFSSQAIRAGEDEHAAVWLTDQRWMLILHIIIKDTKRFQLAFCTHCCIQSLYGTDNNNTSSIHIKASIVGVLKISGLSWR